MGNKMFRYLLRQIITINAATPTAIPSERDGFIFNNTALRLNKVTPRIPPRKDRIDNEFLSTTISDRKLDISAAKAHCKINKYRKKYQFCRRMK